MKWVLAISLFMIILGSTTFTLSDSSEAKYTRKDCIVRIDFDWSKYGVAEVEKLINRIGSNLDNDLESGIDMYIGGYIFPFKKRDVLYIQYFNKCEIKYNMATSIFEEKIQPNINQPLNYVVSKEIVIPSPNTIWLTGKFWREDEHNQ